ncbi:MAG: hypothetical protein V1799_20055 [bacterium]
MKKQESLVIEASIKPMMSLVWVGTVTMINGFLLIIFQRMEKAILKHSIDADIPENHIGPG